MTELEKYRQQIDDIDSQLVRLFLDRLEVTGKVGEYKMARGLPVLDSTREKAVIAKRSAQAPTPAAKARVAALYDAILTISRRQQRLLVREGTEDEGWARSGRQKGGLRHAAGGKLLHRLHPSGL